MGASVDAPTMVGKTALTVCATVGNVKGAEILLQYGASVENKDNSRF